MGSTCIKKNVKLSDSISLYQLAWPIFIESLLGVLLNNVDTLMLSGYSNDAVGAVGNANLILNLVFVLFNIIGVSTAVMVSQYLGADKKSEINTIYSLAFISNTLFGIVLSLILAIFGEPIMNLLGVPDDMITDSVHYMQIVGGFMFLQGGFNVMIQILRCNGLQRIGMFSALSVNILNVLGNWLFLYGALSHLKLGVIGVSISTTFARLVALTIVLSVFFSKKIGKISFRYIIPFPKDIFRTLIFIGCPSAGDNLAYDIYQIILLSLVNGMGNDSINARVYCSTLMSFSAVFASSVATATQILVGYLVGAKKSSMAYKRVIKYLKLCIPIAFVISSVNWLLSPYTLRLFTDNANVIELASHVMLVAVLLEIGRTMNMIVINSLKASGDVRFPFFVGLLSMWGIGLVVGVLCGVVFKLGVVGIFLGTASDEFIRGIIVTIRWIRKRWMGKSFVN